MLDAWGRGLTQSEPIEIEPDASHSLVVVSRALAPESAGLTHTAVYWDGKLAIYLAFPTHESSPEEVFWGIDAIGSSAAGEFWAGDVLSVRSEPLAAWTEPERANHSAFPGAATFKIELGSLSLGQSNPLLVTGESGAADAFYVTRNSDASVRFGYDHWGVGGPQSGVIAIPSAQFQIVRIELGTSPEAGEARGYRVTLDGKVVLEGETALYPARGDQIFLKTNPTGASSCQPMLVANVAFSHYHLINQTGGELSP